VKEIAKDRCPTSRQREGQGHGEGTNSKNGQQSSHQKKYAVTYPTEQMNKKDEEFVEGKQRQALDISVPTQDKSATNQSSGVPSGQVRKGIKRKKKNIKRSSL